MEKIRIDFSPSSGTPEEWNDAYARLADYFRAHRIRSRVHRTYLILETLRRAAERHPRHPGKTPMEVVIHEARMVPRPIDLGPMAERTDDESGILDYPWLRYLVLAAFAAIVICGLYLVTRR